MNSRPLSSPGVEVATHVVDPLEALTEAPFAETATTLRRATHSAVSWPFVAADVLAVVVALVCAQTLGAAHSWPVLAATPVIWVATLALAGNYIRPPGRGRLRARGVAGAGVLLALVGSTYVAVFPDSAVGEPAQLARAALLTAVLATGLTLLARVVTRYWAAPRTVSVVVTGEATAVARMLEAIDRAGQSAYRVVAVCLPDESWADSASLATQGRDLPVWYGTSRLAAVADVHHADAVLAAPSADLDYAALRRLGHHLQDAHVQLLVGTGLRDVRMDRIELTGAGGLRLLALRAAPLSGPRRVAKDLVDRLLAGILLAWSTPVLLVVAMLIRRDSAGPALYRQVRVGRGGRHFTVYKFRTMCDGAESMVPTLFSDNDSDEDGVLFKLFEDPRVTTIGARLRRSSLDELPQLINVLRGEMSLVGPRPALPSEVALYDEDVTRRLVVKPGMTGLWQVSGRSDLPWEETVRLDLAYVDNWSWSVDLRIALRTIGAVLTSRGAY